MLEQLQSWWQLIPPEAQAVLPAVGVVLGALLGGYVLGKIVAGVLRARNFDAALRLAGAAPPGAEADRGFTPTRVAGLLVQLTVWTGAAWWLARQYGQDQLAGTLVLVLGRTWAGAAVLAAALALASLLTRRLLDCLQGPAKAGAEAWLPPAAPHGNAAGVVGAGVYGLVLLLALLMAADLFDWPLTRSSAQALWQLAHNLLIAGAALLVGGLGARWARDLVKPEGASSPEKRAGQYTALGIVAATTVLAVAVLLSGAALPLALAALAVLGCLLWLVRGYLPDLTAGLQLRAQKVRELCFNGTPWQVTEVGLLTTTLMRGGEFYHVQNRLALEALFQAAPAAATAGLRPEQNGGYSAPVRR
jgi:hypothetical protein